jgi:hypothetical protein
MLCPKPGNLTPALSRTAPRVGPVQRHGSCPGTEPAGATVFPCMRCLRQSVHRPSAPHAASPPASALKRLFRFTREGSASRSPAATRGSLSSCTSRAKTCVARARTHDAALCPCRFQSTVRSRAPQAGLSQRAKCHAQRARFAAGSTAARRRGYALGTGAPEPAFPCNVAFANDQGSLSCAPSHGS